MSTSVDPYAYLRLCVDQLTRLLATQPRPTRGELDELDRRLAGLLGRLGKPDDHPPAVADAISKVQAERKAPQPNHHRIGAQLMRLVGAVASTTGAYTGAKDVATDAEDLAEAFLAVALI